MGRKGTDAARQAADLVLADDNFATIARAVREGRVVFDNIKKSLLFLLPTNCGEAGIVLLAVPAGIALPVTTGQILLGDRIAPILAARIAWRTLLVIAALGLAKLLAFEAGKRLLRHLRVPGM